MYNYADNKDTDWIIYNIEMIYQYVDDKHISITIKS